jgi:hypothetical protein
VFGSEFPVKLFERSDTPCFDRCDAFENGDAIGISVDQHLDVVGNRRKARRGCSASQVRIITELNLHGTIVHVTRSNCQTDIVG